MEEYIQWNSNGLAGLFGRALSLESLSGRRLTAFQAYNDGAPFENLIAALKKYKFTVKDFTGYKKDWTGEQVMQLARLLQPDHMNLESVGSKLYEELLTVDSLKGAHVRVDLDNVLDAAAKLLPRLAQLYINLPFVPGSINNLHLSSEQLLDLLPRLLTLLFSNQWPNLRDFRFLPDYDGNLSMEQIEKSFKGLDLTIETAEGNRGTVYFLKKPELADRLHCYININQNGKGGDAVIIYNSSGNFVH